QQYHNNQDTLLIITMETLVLPYSIRRQKPVTSTGLLIILYLALIIILGIFLYHLLILLMKL
ncbi:hypothetical protein ET272_24650, partial [Salmonella enterica]|nr:hypothetical protein [Salmonella enterica]